MILRPIGATLALGSLITVLGSCGGGGGSAPPPAASRGPAALAKVAISITLPPAPSAHQRRLQYVSTATQSATILVSSGGTSLPLVVIPCNTASCSASLSAPAGATDSFVISLYDGTNGTGNVLSTNTIAQFITANQVNAINATVNPVVASVVLSLSPNQLTQGTSATSNLTVTAHDADGKTIIGPGTFSTAAGAPVTVTLFTTDTPTVGSGGTSLAQTTVTAPLTSTILLSYGGALLTSTLVNATVTGGLPVTAATLTYIASGPPSLGSGTWPISDIATNPFSLDVPQLRVYLGELDSIPMANGFYNTPVTIWNALAPSGCVPVGSTKVFNSIEVAFNLSSPALPAGWTVTGDPEMGFLQAIVSIQEADPTTNPAANATLYIEGSCTVVATQTTTVNNNDPITGYVTLNFNATAPVSGLSVTTPVNGTYVIEWWQ